MRVTSALATIAFTATVALVTPAFADGHAAEGEKVFRKCKACHAVEEGKNKVGPSLYNIVGRTPGTVEGFKYSKAMEAFGADNVWDEDTLDTYLEKPKDLVKGTKMAFVGLKKEDDRENVIAYLKQFSE
ncbi:MAG: cytochrome c family protein [Kiloniellaceae bacterium]